MKRSIVQGKLLGIAVVFFLTSPSFAAEISLLQGIYSSSKDENGITSTTINFGGRYGLDPDGQGFWFGQAFYSQTSFSGNGAPDSQSSIRIGGGRRYLLPAFSKRIEPYLSWLAELEQGKNLTGLYYGGQVGLRFILSPKFFLDLESSLFRSALTETEEVDVNGVTQKRTKTELQASTVAAFSNVAVSVGMRL
ncbi:MAG: hypothetical protein ACOH5I_08475 [Oligoflexus sp.]